MTNVYYFETKKQALAKVKRIRERGGLERERTTLPYSRIYTSI